MGGIRKGPRIALAPSDSSLHRASTSSSGASASGSDLPTYADGSRGSPNAANTLYSRPCSGVISPSATASSIFCSVVRVSGGGGGGGGGGGVLDVPPAGGAAGTAGAFFLHFFFFFAATADFLPFLHFFL